jgi:hypothetical protein
MTEDDPFLDALEGLVQDGSFHDAMERLYLIAKIEKGIKQVEAGETVSQQQAWERMRQWLR